MFDAIRATPLARRAARQAGVDLTVLQGSGHRGRIFRRDVPDAELQAKSPSIAALTPPSRRPHIATKSGIPHFYIQTICVIDALHKLHTDIGAADISIISFLLRAAALALRAVPEANVVWGETTMRHYREIGIGYTLSETNHQVTPVIARADRKRVGAIAAELVDLKAQADAGTLMPEMWAGGAVSVSNLGALGVEAYSDILDDRRSAAFAVGAPREIVLPRVSGVSGVSGVGAATVMTVTLSVDHRAVDGAVAASLLSAFKRLIETPAQILA